jgi:hypothetical protein
MRFQFRSFAFGLALSTVIGTARADVIVTGTLDHLHIEASQAPILVVLEALKKQFGIDYRYRVRSDWIIDGTFAGLLCHRSCLGFSGTRITCSGSPIIP